MKAIAAALAVLISSTAFAQNTETLDNTTRTGTYTDPKTGKTMNWATSPEIRAARKCALHKAAIASIENDAKGKPTLEQRVQILERKAAYSEDGCETRKR